VLEAVTEVSDPVAVERLVMRVEKDLGPISVLVNNAGIGADSAGEGFRSQLWCRGE